MRRFAVTAAAAERLFNCRGATPYVVCLWCAIPPKSLELNTNMICCVFVAVRLSRRSFNVAAHPYFNAVHWVGGWACIFFEQVASAGCMLAVCPQLA